MKQPKNLNSTYEIVKLTEFKLYNAEKLVYFKRDLFSQQQTLPPSMGQWDNQMKSTKFKKKHFSNLTRNHFK